MGVAVAADRLVRRLEWCGLDSGQRLGLRDVEDRREPKASELQLVVVVVGPLVVALAVADRCEDADCLLALADAAAEFQPAAEPGDMRRVRALERDQQRVAQRYLGASRACPRCRLGGAWRRGWAVISGCP